MAIPLGPDLVLVSTARADLVLHDGIRRGGNGRRVGSSVGKRRRGVCTIPRSRSSVVAGLPVSLACLAFARSRSQLTVFAGSARALRLSSLMAQVFSTKNDAATKGALRTGRRGVCVEADFFSPGLRSPDARTLRVPRAPLPHHLLSSRHSAPAGRRSSVRIEADAWARKLLRRLLCRRRRDERGRLPRRAQQFVLSPSSCTRSASLMVTWLLRSGKCAWRSAGLRRPGWSFRRSSFPRTHMIADSFFPCPAASRITGKQSLQTRRRCA